ncbi:hypothetical protein CNR22_04850 [Sphingobacteriaceae bacterium]|nr:hypothetical protein CNR22_04850 [Sphingobacteriaceae bacterium]
MIRSRLKKLLFLGKRIGFYLPFTLYFLLFALAAFLGYRWLHRASEIPDSSYKDIFKLLLSLALFVGSFILCLGMLSVSVAFVYFKLQQRRRGILVRLTTTSTEDGSKQKVSIYIHPILQPLLGYIRIRLNYDETRYSKKFDLVKLGKGKIINTALDGVYSWDLPEIREYRIEKVIVYFEDFFQFFSFATPLLANNSFYTPPKVQEIKSVHAFPRKTEEQTTRIEELKKVEGEYINYKNFENSDDVRRIVWKIYAKNKELVVRIPEVLDPYASHIYFYPSFFSSFDVRGNEVIEVPFLNYYKTMCWSLYQQFERKGFEVRYVSDQPIPQSANSNDDRTKYAITLSSWQTETQLKSFFDPKDAAVVLLSSLSEVEQVKELVDRYGHNVSFVFVPLTESLNDLDFTHWLQWIFIQQETDKTATYRSSWNLSKLRFKIEQNEKELKLLLKDHQQLVIN